MAAPFSRITVDIAKLRDYCLSEAHPRGRHKARVFRTALGLSGTDAEALRQVLLREAWENRAVIRSTMRDEYGERYILDFPMTTAAGRAMLRSTWIVLTSEDVLRLTSCYVL